MEAFLLELVKTSPTLGILGFLAFLFMRGRKLIANLAKEEGKEARKQATQAIAQSLFKIVQEATEELRLNTQELLAMHKVSDPESPHRLLWYLPPDFERWMQEVQERQELILQQQETLLQRSQAQQ